MVRTMTNKRNKKLDQVGAAVGAAHWRITFSPREKSLSPSPTLKKIHAASTVIYHGSIAENP